MPVPDLLWAVTSATKLRVLHNYKPHDMHFLKLACVRLRMSAGRMLMYNMACRRDSLGRVGVAAARGPVFCIRALSGTPIIHPDSSLSSYRILLLAVLRSDGQATRRSSDARPADGQVV